MATQTHKAFIVTQSQHCKIFVIVSARYFTYINYHNLQYNLFSRTSFDQSLAFLCTQTQITVPNNNICSI